MTKHEHLATAYIPFLMSNQPIHEAQGKTPTNYDIFYTFSHGSWCAFSLKDIQFVVIYDQLSSCHESMISVVHKTVQNIMTISILTLYCLAQKVAIFDYKTYNVSFGLLSYFCLKWNKLTNYV